MWNWLLVFVVGFSVGVGTLFVLEVFGVYVLIQRLNRKVRVEQSKLDDDSSLKDLDPHESLEFVYNKKGFIWVLEPEKVPKNWLVAPKEQKKKKEFFEVNPVRKHANIKDRSLILKGPDNSLTTISLKGCRIEAVSATGLPSRKWAKRFPIKLERKGSAIYHGSKILYIYLETSWEKESWCKALRLAACEDNDQLTWFTKLNEDFHNYLTSLNTGYPSFLKPSGVFTTESTDRLPKFDGSGSNSRVRVFFKKLARKASEHKGISFMIREERKPNEKSRLINDSILSGSSSRGPSGAKLPIYYEEDNAELPSYSRSSSQSLVSLASDLESDEKLNIDEGTLCLNLLISRLFFDARRNTSMKNSLQTRIQRTLSNMRIPSYIGEVKCTGINLGNLPPHIHAIRVLPADMNEAWAWEMDIEYCGGIILDIETRLEVRDLNFQKGAEDTNSELISTGVVPSDLLEGIEDIGDQLNLSEGNVDSQGLINERVPTQDEKNLNSGASTSTQSTTSKWKSMLNSIAKQVQQMPISLSIRVESLRGTLRCHIKPPPSDQLWFGFTSMPDIEFGLESAFGEHKITNGQVALFLMNKFKNSIRDTMVLPNCENACIPWMFADKNDWVPRSAAPFIWLNQEATSDHGVDQDILSPQPGEAKMKTDSSGCSTSGGSENGQQRMTNTEIGQQPVLNSSDASARPLMKSSKSFQDLTKPLLVNGESQETSQQSRDFASANHSPSRSLKLVGQSSQSEEDDSKPKRIGTRAISQSEEDDSKPKRIGTRARMFDLGKKMGEKFEEKKRHLESKGKNIVEKMRGT